MAIPFWFEGFDGYPLVTKSSALNYLTGQRGYAASGGLNGGFGNDPILGNFMDARQLRFFVPDPDLHDTFTFGGAMFANSTYSHPVLTLEDADGVFLYLNITQGGWVLNYNPTGTINDIAASGSAPVAVNFYEVVWTPSTLKLFINNEEVYSKSWAGRPCRPRIVGGTDTSSQVYVYNVYYGPTRLGMHRVQVLPLEAPTVDTGAETGAASPQLALSSFDQDTSYYTLVNGTAQTVLMPVGDLPSEVEVVHGVKLSVQSRKTDAGAVTGSIQVKTASESTVATTIDAVGYATGHTVLTNDPHTAAPFTGAAINSMQVGVKEGV